MQQQNFASTIIKPRVIEKLEEHVFIVPEKKIRTVEQMEQFARSAQYSEYMTFVCAMQDSVMSKSISSTDSKLEESKNQAFAKFKQLFEQLNVLVDQVELLPRSQARFGNPAFKEWHQKAMVLGEKFFTEFLDEQRKNAYSELYCYYADCFGSNVRIDYGTGHELNFSILMLCLVKLGYFVEEEYELLVRGLFYRYQRTILNY